MTTKLVGKKLVIEIDLEDHPRPSSSGKTLVVGSTGGFVQTGLTYKGSPVSLSLNVTIRRTGENKDL